MIYERLFHYISMQMAVRYLKYATEGVYLLHKCRLILLLDARASIGGGRVPHFSAWGDSIGIVPPLFSSEKLRGK